MSVHTHPSLHKAFKELQVVERLLRLKGESNVIHRSRKARPIHGNAYLGLPTAREKFDNTRLFLKECRDHFPIKKRHREDREVDGATTGDTGLDWVMDCGRNGQKETEKVRTQSQSSQAGL